ncbi:type II CRISPR RNA-guided endonuclease Cas9 [Candidatus Saccharibacteria bacterium]|nr:type II CRISPR RNA-guided endonuclease Cas9 [Candidatus Saccharibacteria bacterium]
MKYSLGLDIGTTSVGWAVVNEDIKRIEDCGVRIFETPENPKNGESLAKPRRDARSTRRRLHRRRQRLNYLKSFFIQNDLLSAEQIETLLNPAKEPKIDPYEARNKGIKEKLTSKELFIALYHIAKRRGYKSNRKKVEEKGDESGKVLKAISSNKTYLEKYTTIGSALYNDKNFETHKRNKSDSYQNSFIREDFEAEARAILEKQDWSEEKINELFHDPRKQWGGVFDQRPFMTEEFIQKMRGNCPYEKGEQRAWKASYTFELFRLTEDLSHLEYNHGKKLTSEQIESVIEAAKNQKTGLTYKKVREVIGYKNAPSFKFDYIRGKQKKSYEETEKNKFCEMKFFHTIKSAATENDWKAIEPNFGEYSDEKVGLLDYIGYVLTVNKDDKNVEKALSKLSLSPETKSNLMSLSFSGFAHLSMKALKKLTSHLLNGETYDKAVEAAYPGEFTAKLSGDKNQLPPLSEAEKNQLTNPVVKRAIGQTRKVINAIIKKYGSPYQIKIECGRDLSKSASERREDTKRQNDAEKANQGITKILGESFGIANPTGHQISKYKLFEEQSNQCIYCGKIIRPTKLFSNEKYYEIDHIMPRSRKGSLGKENQVLACAECNQEKKNSFPYEKWGQDTKRWEEIRSRAISLKNEKKANRILSETLIEEDWASRALNDTRYITIFISKYIKKHLKFNNNKDKECVILTNGKITDEFRRLYRLGQKKRNVNNLHHAIDACITAVMSKKQIDNLTNWYRLQELGYHPKLDETLPWKRFDDEVRWRVNIKDEKGGIEDLQTFRDRFRDFKTYDEEFLSKIHPLFVSRLPKRSAKGSAHKETIRSPKKTDDDRRLTRKRLIDCELKDIENSVLPESDQALYNQLKMLWQEKGEDAFKEPIWKNNKKVDKNGRPLSPVSTIKVYSTEPSGILINRGTQFVNNGDTACLDVWFDEEKKKYVFNPVYVHLVRSKKRKLPYSFKFSIYPNDYVRIKLKHEEIEGYYVGFDISSNRVELIHHNSADKSKSNKIRKGLGSTQNVQLINISILGDNYPWRGAPSQ